jgi:hypothetical protein
MNWSIRFARVGSELLICLTIPPFSHALPQLRDADLSCIRDGNGGRAFLQITD